MKVYFAADHAGFELKRSLMDAVRALGHEVEDCGAFEFESGDDYPDFVGAAAGALARDEAAGERNRAIVIGASGQGEAMAANRFRGVRCALYYGKAEHPQSDASGHTLDMLASTRAHNDANALSLAARFLSEEEAQSAVTAWLQGGFSGEERHIRRVGKLDLLG